MPTYEYANEKGSEERFFVTYRDAPDYIYIGGQRAYRKIGGVRTQCARWSTGLVSDAAAIHPRQIQKAMEIDKRNGVPTKYDRWGRPTFTSRDHRKRYLKAHRMFDMNGGYGD